MRSLDYFDKHPVFTHGEFVSAHTATGRSPNTSNTLLRKHVAAPDGSVTQHGDLADLRLAHAAGHNGPSVDIEIVNPFYPYRLTEDLPWKESIPAPWAHRGAYVLPTPEQAEATAQLIG